MDGTFWSSIAYVSLQFDLQSHKNESWAQSVDVK